MRSHLHADHAGPWPTHRATKSEPTELGPLRVRPPWLVFLAKHFAPRNHERYLLQGVDLTDQEWAAVRALPRPRPGWLAFLYRQFHRLFPNSEGERLG